jgi:hypothetical protein
MLGKGVLWNVQRVGRLALQNVRRPSLRLPGTVLVRAGPVARRTDRFFPGQCAERHLRLAGCHLRSLRHRQPRRRQLDREHHPLQGQTTAANRLIEEVRIFFNYKINCNLLIVSRRAIIRDLGLFVVVEVFDLGLVVRWDKGTRVYVNLDPKWKNRVCPYFFMYLNHECK